MNWKISEKENLFYRCLLALVIILIAAGLRIAPHPWNFTPIGAMAGVWALGDFYPRTLAGLAACYIAGVPFFWNTLAGDAFYVGILFGSFALAERWFPALREPAPQLSH